jgi:16S rRNA (guanine966-N2)-methyltransferase
MPLKPNHFRIIAGRFRSRQLLIPDHTAVRPTPNRVRETLFNWLMKDIHGAVCVDAFAGSGSLGFEAISRGAAQVYFIEKEGSVFETLAKNSALFKTTEATLLHGSMPASLSKINTPLDIVFLDPPFHQDLILPSLLALQESRLLKKGSLVYLEVERRLDLLLQLDPAWQVLKHKRAGQVAYYLLTYGE